MGQISVEKNVGGIEGLCVITPAVHGDNRGYFMETYNENDMKEAGLDAVMLCPGEEMEFLAGFRPMMCERFQGLFVKADGSMFYICNLLYEDEFRKELPDSVPLYAWFRDSRPLCSFSQKFG